MVKAYQLTTMQTTTEIAEILARAILKQVKVVNLVHSDNNLTITCYNWGDAKNLAKAIRRNCDKVNLPKSTVEILKEDDRIISVSVIR